MDRGDHAFNRSHKSATGSTALLAVPTGEHSVRIAGVRLGQAEFFNGSPLGRPQSAAIVHAEQRQQRQSSPRTPPAKRMRDVFTAETETYWVFTTVLFERAVERGRSESVSQTGAAVDGVVDWTTSQSSVQERVEDEASDKAVAHAGAVLGPCIVADRGRDR